MSKDKISDYSSTANSNTDIAGINIDEGCAPSGINDAIRTLMAQIKALYAGTSGDKWPVSGGGTGATTAADARTNLGLVIGTDVQAYDADLASIASSGKGDQIASYGTYGIGFRNRIINGAMAIDQRNAGASVSYSGSTSAYSVDRWLGFQNTDGAFTLQQVSDAPSGYINSLKFTTTTADASLGSTQWAAVRQSIEGLNVFDLAFGSASAASITVSFWVKSSLTGTFGGAILNSAENRSYPFNYTISAANTWEQKSVTIPGDTSGTWLTTNGVGLRLVFGLGVGSTYSGTANAWTGSSYIYSSTGATSVIGTLNATWQITGVQLEKGSTATSFDYRPYGTELALCQRYYVKYANSGTGFLGITGQVSGTNGSYFLFPISMRATPTPGFSNINSNDTSVNNAVSSIGVDSNTTNCVRAAFSCSSNTLTVGRAALIYTASNGYIDFSAEL